MCLICLTYTYVSIKALEFQVNEDTYVVFYIITTQSDVNPWNCFILKLFRDA